MNEEPLRCPHCGGESFFEFRKVISAQTGRLTKDGFITDDEFYPSYQDDTAEVFSYMCAECTREWKTIEELKEAIESK